MTVEEAIASKLFSHARVKTWCRQESIYIYHYRPDSPTGVILADVDSIVYDTPEIEALFRKYGRTSPLSPTERR